MQIKLSSWLSLFAFLALFVAQAAAQAEAAAQPAGKIKATRVEGTVTVKDLGGATRTLTPKVDADINQGSIINTGANGSVVLLFSNGASINLSPSSELNIVTFTQNPFEGTYEPAKETEEPSASTTDIVLNRGELVGNVKKLKQGAGGSRFTVGTPVGAAGIRGTTFRIVYRPEGNGRGSFILTTVEGKVELEIGTGTIAQPKGVVVSDSREVILNDISIDTTTNQVVATTSTGQTITVAAAPPASDAAVTTVQQVQAVAQILVQAIVDKVFTSPTPTGTTTTSNDTKTDTTKKEEKKEEPPPPPPTNTNQSSSSNPN